MREYFMEGLSGERVQGHVTILNETMKSHSSDYASLYTA